MKPHPSMLLFCDAWRKAMAYAAPSLLITLSRESQRYYKLNAHWLMMVACANYAKYLASERDPWATGRHD